MLMRTRCLVCLLYIWMDKLRATKPDEHYHPTKKLLYFWDEYNLNEKYTVLACMNNDGYSFMLVYAIAMYAIE